MANFSSSNMLATTKKTVKRGCRCPYCGMVNWSTAKNSSILGWYMNFNCRNCGRDYEAYVRDCWEDK